MGKRQDIQGLRAVAVLMVVAFHAGLPLTGGFAGVDVFFVISGFVIGRLLIREIETTGTVALGRFFASRIKRLVPALTFVLLAVLLAALLITIGDRTADIISSAFAALLMYANVFFERNTGGYFDVQDDEIPLLHTWTLSVEAQFYLVAPLALLVAWRLAAMAGTPRRRTITTLTVVVALTSFVLAQTLATGHTFRGLFPDPQASAFFGSPTRVWEFLLGSLVALAEPRLSSLVQKRAAELVATLGLAAILLAAFVAGSKGPVPGTGLLLPVGGATLLIAGTTAHAGRVAEVLGWPPLTFIGDLSYSWYLWHWPVIVFGALAVPDRDLAVVFALASLLPAWLSYRLVENRVRASASVRGGRAALLGVACVAVFATTAVAVSAAQPRLARAAGIPNLVRALESKALADGGRCRRASGSPWISGTREVAYCTPEIPKSAPRILLVGDSQADAYASAWLKIARARRMRLDLVVGNNCLVVPILDGSGERPPTEPGCEKLLPILKKAISADPPKFLVVAQSENYDVVGAKIPRPDRVPASMEAISVRAEHALTQIAGPAAARGAATVFLRAVPGHPKDGSICGTAIKILLGEVRTCLSRPYPADADSATADPYWHAVLRFANRAPHTVAYDPARLLCPQHICSQIHAEQLAYRDGNHLSAEGAASLSPWIEDAMTDGARDAR